MEYDSRKLRIEFHKADALRELRPHLDARRGKNPKVVSACSKLRPPVVRYLSRIVYAHLEALLESYPLPPDVDIDSFTDRALQDARQQVNSMIVDQIAAAVRIYLVDMARVTYLRALTTRTGPASPSHFGMLDHDPDYETWTREAFESLQAGSRSATKPERGKVKSPAQKGKLKRRSVGPVRDARKKKKTANTVEQLKRERNGVLTAYKRETGVQSDRAIYGCAGKPGTHSCHKPQFLQWKSGHLSPNSQPCQSLETFLRERRTPPAKQSRDRKNLPSLPGSTN